MRIPFIRLLALGALGLAAAGAHANEKKIEERIAADANGNVEINDVAGSIDLQGWDKPQVEVTGTAGSDVERVAVDGEPGHIIVQVITRQNRLWGSDGSARLLVHVPSRSSVTVTLVSADFAVSGLVGNLKLQSVSGEVKGDLGGDIRAGTVSGNVHLNARSAKSIAIKTVSGDITLNGGSGETEMSTVSGTIKVEEGTQSRVHFKSVSGDILATFGMTGDAQVEGETVSGDLKFNFSTTPAAEFDVQSFSGDIENCFGPKPVQPEHGPGSRLNFKNGNGNAHVQISTKSGDINLCTGR